MKIISILALVVLIYGCNCSSNRTKEFVEYGTAKVEEEVVVNISRERKDLENLYLTVISKNTNMIKVAECQKFYNILNETLDYIDSIKIITNKIGTNDLSGINKIRKKFIDEGIADSILSEIILTYTSAERCNSRKKSFINQSRKNLLNEPDIEGRKILYFSHSTPDAAIWTLMGFEQELVKLGKEIFAK